MVWWSEGRGGRFRRTVSLSVLAVLVGTAGCLGDRSPPCSEYREVPLDRLIDSPQEHDMACIHSVGYAGGLKSVSEDEDLRYHLHVAPSEDSPSIQITIDRTTNPGLEEVDLEITQAREVWGRMRYEEGGSGQGAYTASWIWVERFGTAESANDSAAGPR